MEQTLFKVGDKVRLVVWASDGMVKPPQTSSGYNRAIHSYNLDVDQQEGSLGIVKAVFRKGTLGVFFGKECPIMDLPKDCFVLYTQN